MTYQTPLFKFIDRGFKKNILLVPGWGTDWRIFERLDIPFNYFLIKQALPGDARKAFMHIPDEMRSSGISILGWSMGGFIAADLVSESQQNLDRIILVSIRRRYDMKGIEHIRTCLKRNAKAYLCKFYGGLFSENEKENKRWFREGLLKKYIEDSPSLHLSDGLNYLSKAELNPCLLNLSNVTFIHGEDDTIAPIEEARSIVSEAPLARSIFIKGACHLPFLRKEFAEIF